MSNIITKSSLSSSILIRFVICLIGYDAAATFIVLTESKWARISRQDDGEDDDVDDDVYS